MPGLGDIFNLVGLWTHLSPKILERQVVAIANMRFFLVLSDPCIVHRPQTQGEEELQLQLALAMSRQETNSYQLMYFLIPRYFYPLTPFLFCSLWITASTCLWADRKPTPHVLKGSQQWESRGVRNLSICPNLARTAAIEVRFSLNFAVVFDFIYFRFRPSKAK